MPRKEENKFDSAITVRMKRYDQTFFIVCSEYESVGALKGRIIDAMNQSGY